MTSKVQKPSLEKADATTTKKDCGSQYMFKNFLSQEEAEDAFDVLIDDAKFPWDTKPELYGQPLNKYTSEHDLLDFAKEQKKERGRITDTSNTNIKGLLKLGELCAKIENQFDVRVSFVFCNRFQNVDHPVNWHKDAYEEHICVLTLGSKRRIEFRNNRTQEIKTMTPNAGDLYVMPLKMNETHTHRVCSADETDAIGTNAGARLSFVFFFEAPKYAKTKHIEIAKKENMVGFIKGVVA